MASSAWEIICVALPKYCLLVGVGRLELLGGSLGEASRRTIQRSVLVHSLPVSTRRPLYRTSTCMPNFVKLTLHPSSYSFTNDIRETLASPGMI